MRGGCCTSETREFLYQLRAAGGKTKGASDFGARARLYDNIPATRRRRRLGSVIAGCPKIWRAILKRRTLDFCAPSPAPGTGLIDQKIEGLLNCDSREARLSHMGSYTCRAAAPRALPFNQFSSRLYLGFEALIIILCTSTRFIVGAALDLSIIFHRAARDFYRCVLDLLSYWIFYTFRRFYEIFLSSFRFRSKLIVKVSLLF